MIPVFFAADDNYAPFLSIAVASLLDNCNKNKFYKIHIIHDNMSLENMKKIKKLEKPYSQIIFNSIGNKLEFIGDNLDNRLRPDIFTLTIYFRLFIPEIFKEYDKAIYIDSDIVVNGDISNLYDIDLENNYIGGCRDKSIVGIKEFENYFTKGVGINYTDYINSGVLLLNMKELRNKKLSEKFLYLFNKYHFENVDPDQAYLNFLCNGKIKYLDNSWNAMPNVKGEVLEHPNIIHYNLFFKPWHYDNITYENYFWKYAKESNFYEKINEIKNNFSIEDKKKDDEHLKNMLNRADIISKSSNNFRTIYESGQEGRL